jgi:hypothetical protein
VHFIIQVDCSPSLLHTCIRHTHTHTHTCARAHTPKVGHHAYVQRQLHFSYVLSITDLNICNDGAYKMQRLRVRVCISTLKLKICDYAIPNDIYSKRKSLPQQSVFLTFFFNATFTSAFHTLCTSITFYFLYRIIYFCSFSCLPCAPC